MNDFEKCLKEINGKGIYALDIKTMQVSIGLRCNQQCAHCHLEASPRRTEMMEWSIMQLVIEAAKSARCKLVDLTGGSPELNPHFREFVEALHKGGYKVQLRTNLTVLLEPGMETMPEFLRDHGVQIVASLPCYMKENVCAQRGEGVYEKSINVLKRLNAIGYGSNSGLTLNLVYNPVGLFLPPVQSKLEADYKRELSDRFGITFNHLLTITNMPIGRFLKELRRQDQERSYRQLLKESFNPQTLDKLMCLNQINVGWDGTLYDCDFNLALRLPVSYSAPDYIASFDPSVLRARRIVTGDHCFGCTAGHGSSCEGALL